MPAIGEDEFDALSPGSDLLSKMYCILEILTIKGLPVFDFFRKAGLILNFAQAFYDGLYTVAFNVQTFAHDDSDRYFPNRASSRIRTAIRPLSKCLVLLVLDRLRGQQC
jgi:hypothetical protein